LKQLNTLIYKNTPHNSKKCARCQNNTGSKLYKLRFKHSYSARMCVICLNTLAEQNNLHPGPAGVLWLEKNALFNKKGQLIGFQKNNNYNLGYKKSVEVCKNV
jgi:hypothetical protein